MFRVSGLRAYTIIGLRVLDTAIEGLWRSVWVGSIGMRVKACG